MVAKLIDGKSFAVQIRSEIATQVKALLDSKGIKPGLAVILVGEDPASQVYVRSKGKQTIEVGMNSYEYKLDKHVSEGELLGLIEKLNSDENVNGILCQLPLPDHLNSDLVINSINPEKDVDGFHISNVGLLATGQKSMVPCTPLGCLMMLRSELGDLSGKNAVIIGRSNIVGKPMAHLLIKDSCTVTIAHSRTKNIEELCRSADILVAAVGRPEMVKANWIKEGAAVIDVGINRVEVDPEVSSKGYKIVGDVDFESAKSKAGFITPVPGGVGPMTIACLLANTLTACCRTNGLPEPDGLTA
ncbi:MAG: bifunctional methylenetetrahydrofolate dehydrogenase/methenyltetrahydrofolate cyclohydrolase FolD [Rhodobacteraceae bacterium]|nr:MAG: bifunctional methylenetetrahydrofolate dehydrogenase/methenyltetrahydrofolate cyclohydrolase FolD [Paracoccaceae bacterium]